MKSILTFIALSLILISCSTNPSVESNREEGINVDSLPQVPLDTLKSADETSDAETDATVQHQVNERKGNTCGKVSHKFRKNGCATVIIVQGKSGEDELVLIPKDALAEELDKDGRIIYFNYQQLRMPNPAGCIKGMPAEITNAEAE